MLHLFAQTKELQGREMGMSRGSCADRNSIVPSGSRFTSHLREGQCAHTPHGRCSEHDAFTPQLRLCACLPPHPFPSGVLILPSRLSKEGEAFLNQGGRPPVACGGWPKVFCWCCSLIYVAALLQQDSGITKPLPCKAKLTRLSLKLTSGLTASLPVLLATRGSPGESL